MRFVGALKRVARFARRLLRYKAPAAAQTFSPDEIDWVSDTYFVHGSGPGTHWDRALRDAHMRLPSWFQHGLNPLSEAYADQQHRLWRLMSGVDRPYEPAIDEKEHSWGDIDPVRTPGFYVRRDPQAIASASDHVLATGMLLKHCALKAGDWALEYGAGFGQTALALARLGVNVDTVDISATFCDYIRRQAEFFQVPLSPFHGAFGLNPRPGEKYHLIWFYESFHHCLDFQNVVMQLREHVRADGRVILSGEPIVERENAAVPYPWGMRLHSEVAAVVRKQHWFELGFSEDFLFELFIRAGFTGQRIDCEPSLFGRLYVFEPRAESIALAQQWLPPRLAEMWQSPKVGGRATKAHSRLPLDTAGSFSAIEVDLTNPLRHEQRVEIEYSDSIQVVHLQPGQQITVRFTATRKTDLVMRCSTRWPVWLDWMRAVNARSRGIFVKQLRYIAI